jgi:shikimate dehydrogenase
MAEGKMIRAFVTGFPVAHSRSPMIHGHWLKYHGVEGSYERAPIAPADFAAFMNDLKSGAAGYSGGNVTIPHKETALALADRPDELASELGAANTLWLKDGLVHATNTDGYGFTANLDDAAPGWDASAKDSRAVVLGAGGASRAVVVALRDRGFAEICVVNRTVERAASLARRFGERVSAHPNDALPEVMAGARFFVNTTSLGMAGEPPMPSLDFSLMSSQAVVTDIVYAPLMTPLLTMAQGAGLRTVDGLGMLLHQAVPGFEKWFGVRPQVSDDLRARIIADLGSGH